MFSRDGLLPDHFVYATLVKSCAELGVARIGRQAHANFSVSPYWCDDVVKSSLVDMYAKCGLPDDARAVFDGIVVKSPVSWTSMIYAYARSGRKDNAVEVFRGAPVRSLYSWTALISGLVQSGKDIDAMELYVEMNREGVEIVDPLVLSSVVGACANMALWEAGRQVHGNVYVLGYNSCLFLGNALVDMYAKCSDIEAAMEVFDNLLHRDVVSWTTIIVGAAQHGRAEEALDLFDRMLLDGVRPNNVTFVGLIYACSHVGYVEKGRDLFNFMVKEYGIQPSLQHYTCLLDLLSRSGLLDEAEKLLNEMPFQPDEPTWAALLSACKLHGNAEMAVRVADQLLSLKPTDPSTYILLSNVYARAAMWNNVGEVRKLMTAMAARKKPGYSCIDVGRVSHVFYAGDPADHPMRDEFFGLLKELEAEMRRWGYVPDTSEVLHDMEQQEKERLLFWHSERLALAYGLLRGVPGTVLRIVKNLRVCCDCHVVFTLLSAIVSREIVVRDATRFHHFKDGKCSCNNFW
ncbi:hypothetical protein MLD38_019141 [Melastoma candidum]|nr:hypothetical protein MLD38_019141 [Melastoma candidum]